MTERVVLEAKKAKKKSRTTKSPKTPKVKGKKETIAKQTARNHERKKKEVTEKAETIIRKGNAKDKALELYHQLQQLELTPYFDGATIDLHRERPSVVFIPKTETIIMVDNGQLLDFLKEHGVQMVLIDAQFPSNAEVLSEISKAGIEVYLLKRTTTLSAFRKSLENKHELTIPKNDYNDAILLAFVKPKFWKQVDWRYIECWNYMVLWRDAEKEYRRLDNRIKTYPKLRQDKQVMLRFKMTQVEMINAAKRFVQVVQSHYPEISDLFQRLGIERDPIAMAYAGEIFLEMLAYREFKWFLKSAGIGFPLPTLLKSRRGLYIYDKRLRHALHQLTLKVYHLDLYNDADKRKIPKKMFKLAKMIWNWWQKMIGDGRVGEALGVAGPLEKRGFIALRPARTGSLRKQGRFVSDGTFQGPRHPADRPPQP